MICGTAVNSQPFNLLFTYQLDKIKRRTRVTQHIAALICLRLVKSILMITSVDDQDISLTYLNALLDIFRCIDAEILCHIRQINYNTRCTQLG